jgi:REP element-mobilizing transposase RayT
MKRDYIEFQDRSVVLAYFISFRCYGTWLHGDERGSVDRRHFNTFGAPKIKPDSDRQSTKRRLMKGQSFLLSERERKIVEQAIREVCRVRGYILHALNVRTNHVHLVVSNTGSPERMMDAFKAYSTRALRKAGLIVAESKPWSRHGSTRYLWTEDHIATAVDYVVNGQGDELPSFDR